VRSRSTQLTLRVEQQLIALKRLLERGGHERVSGARVLEDLEVNPEEGQVDHEWPEDETDDPEPEVSPHIGLVTSARQHGSTADPTTFKSFRDGVLTIW
jgi:hypothetical protein